MGQVYTWEAVRDGAVPNIESFASVLSATRSVLLHEPSVKSALFFGSVIRGDYDIRSDIDCAVLYRAKDERTAMQCMQELTRMAKRVHVPMNFVPCDTILVHTHMHHLGRSFSRHLVRSVEAGGLVKGDLLGRLGPTLSTKEETESYIRMKMYTMQESFAQSSSFSEERLVAFYKKMLEAPTHIARKMLIYERTLGGDSKKQVQTRYRETMPRELWKLFDRLLEVNARYTAELHEQLSNPDKARYAQMMQALHYHAPILLRFLRRNILRLVEFEDTVR